MTTIFELLDTLDEKVKEANELGKKLVEELEEREKTEADIWLKTDFKSVGATNDQLRKAYVTNAMSQFPNFYGTKKAELEGLEREISSLKKRISVMESLGIQEFPLTENKDQQ